MDLSSVGLGFPDNLMSIFGYKRMQTNIIAIGCAARVGKDSLAKILEKKLKSHGFSVIRYSLATPLKQECDEFLLKNFHISAFTENDYEKDIIRPILVAVGGAHRKQTEGTYFTKLASKFIEDNPNNFCIIPDLRYAFFPDDEITWLKRNNGMFIYLDRKDKFGNLTPPANKDEEENSIKLSQLADIRFEWNDFCEDKKYAEAQTEGLDREILEYFDLCQK